MGCLLFRSTRQNTFPLVRLTEERVEFYQKFMTRAPCKSCSTYMSRVLGRSRSCTLPIRSAENTITLVALKSGAGGRGSDLDLSLGTRARGKWFGIYGRSIRRDRKRLRGRGIVYFPSSRQSFPINYIISPLRKIWLARTWKSGRIGRGPRQDRIIYRRIRGVLLKKGTLG